jgi:hypothetical protein
MNKNKIRFKFSTRQNTLMEDRERDFEITEDRQYGKLFGKGYSGGFPILSLIKMRDHEGNDHEAYLTMYFVGDTYKISLEHEVPEDEEYSPEEFDVMVKNMGPSKKLKLIFEDFAKDARRVYSKAIANDEKIGQFTLLRL